MQAMLAISNPALAPKRVIDGLMEVLSLVQGSDPAWGVLLEDTDEHESIDECLDSIQNKIESSGWPPREAGLLLRVAIYNPKFTYTGRIRPRQTFVDHGVIVEISVYPVDGDDDP